MSLLKAFFKRKEGKKYKKRWVVLRPLEIDFYDSRKEIQALDTMSMLEVTKVKATKLNLLMMTTEGKKRTLVATTESQAKKWADTCKAVVSRMKTLTQKYMKDLDKKKPKTTMGSDKEVKVKLSERERIAKLLFFDYCARGNFNELKMLKQDAKATDEAGNTALHKAAAGNHIEIVKYLVEVKKVGVNEVNYNGDTCLHTAGWKDSYETVQYLLTKGIDFSIRNKEGKLAVDYAKKLKVKALLESVFSFEDDEDDGEDVDEDAD